MLTALQTYIAAHGTVSIADLSLHFHTDSQALRPMLAKLVHKGRIRSLPTPSKCADCTCCDLSSLECYEWAIPLANRPSPAREMSSEPRKWRC